MAYSSQNSDIFVTLSFMQDLARKEGLTLNYLSAFVKENLNMTFQEYLAGLRLNQAKKLLLSEDKSLLTVSLESGFSDPRYLTRAFLAQMGITPCEYRKRRLRLLEEDNSHRSPASSERFYSDQEALRRLVQK